jgi:hypothetical protein
VTVMLLFYLKLFVVILLILGLVRVWYIFRARSMRAFAAKSGFRYIGPAVPPKWWRNTFRLKIAPPLPAWISHFRPNGERISHVWNVIEGHQDGVLVFIFDAIIGGFRNSHPCTLIACQTEENPFGTVTSSDQIIGSHGWTVLHGTWLFGFSWAMGIKRLDGHLTNLRATQRT